MPYGENIPYWRYGVCYLHAGVDAASCACRAGGIKVAMVPQVPWIRNASLRDNVLFGTPLVLDRYRAVLAACSLNEDIAMLPNGKLQRLIIQYSVCTC
jgi:hypothetical protein